MSRNIHGFHNLETGGQSSSSQSGTRPSGSGYSLGPGGSVVYGAPDSGVNVSLMRAPPEEDDPQGDRFIYKLFPRAKVRSFTFAISVLQVVMFVITLIVGAADCDGAFVSGNDMGGPSGATFYLMGAKWEPAIRAGHIYRLLVPALLHGGVLHILGNLFFQLRFGFSWEARWGTWRVVGMYALATLLSSLFSAICAPETVSVGASGALFGLLGADVAWVVINWALVPDRVQELAMMLFYAVITFLMGIDGRVDNYAHAGGLITGLVAAGWAFEHAPNNDRSENERGMRYGTAVLTAAWALILVCMLWVANPDGTDFPFKAYCDQYHQ